MINTITWLIMDSLSTSKYDDMYNGVSKSTVLEPTIKHLMKEKIIGSSATRLFKEEDKYRSINITNRTFYPEINEKSLKI